MINDVTLILYYYDELDPAERGRVAAAVGQDRLLAARYAALCRELDPLAGSTDIAAPAHAVHRWHESIDRAAQVERQAGERSGRPVHFLSFLWGAAVTAVIALAIGSAFYFADDEPAGPVDEPLLAEQPAGTAHAMPASFSRGLQDYLQQSQFDLAKMGSDDDVNQKALIMQIIEQNRMFERAAEGNNSQKVARVLRAFEPILLRLASDDIAPEDAEELREQLAFELHVMLTNVSKQASDSAETI